MTSEQTQLGDSQPYLVFFSQSGFMWLFGGHPLPFQQESLEWILTGNSCCILEFFFFFGGGVGSRVGVLEPTNILGSKGESVVISCLSLFAVTFCLGLFLDNSGNGSNFSHVKMSALPSGNIWSWLWGILFRYLFSSLCECTKFCCCRSVSGLG